MDTFSSCATWHSPWCARYSIHQTENSWLSAKIANRKPNGMRCAKEWPLHKHCSPSASGKMPKKYSVVSTVRARGGVRAKHISVIENSAESSYHVIPGRAPMLWFKNEPAKDSLHTFRDANEMTQRKEECAPAKKITQHNVAAALFMHISCCCTIQIRHTLNASERFMARKFISLKMSDNPCRPHSPSVGGAGRGTLQPINRCI